MQFQIAWFFYISTYLSLKIFSSANVISLNIYKYGLMAHVFQNCLHIFGAPNTFYCSVKNTGSVSTLLLDSGAHISSHDSNGLTPLDHLTSHPAKLNVMKYTSLKCLAVNVLVVNNARLEVGDAPQHCIEFYRDQLWGNKLLGSLLSKYKSGIDLWRDLHCSSDICLLWPSLSVWNYIIDCITMWHIL